MADLPYPVGNDTNVSFPDINVLIASNYCFGFIGYSDIFSAACLIASLTLSKVTRVSPTAVDSAMSRTDADRFK